MPSRASAKDDLKKVLIKYSYRGPQGYAAGDAEIDSILALYDEYDQGPAVPSNSLKGQGLVEKLNEAVAHAYAHTYEGRKIPHVREQAFKGVSHCPICGISKPGELDHFFPQSKYKPLTIYSRNLVPLCHDCNYIKKAKDEEAGNRLFPHAYFDILPDEDFVRADVAIVNGGLVANFSVAQNVANMPPALYDRLVYQANTLNLSERFGEEISGVLVSHIVNLHLMFREGAQMVRRFLLTQAAVERQTYHRNHWRPVLLQALADHALFCNGGFAIVAPMDPQLLEGMTADTEG
ncbi:HNH endonuclease [Mesorhizobium sp. M2A.F.Ca.ET.037.01.1.1]|uniref:HNH endonuclease n=1 Tax=unclassified Mesorhizobium TaxID=325217 RepID=UPI000FCAFFEA|nr:MULTISPECIES: HNH endonuclease [unclassified Mesorhizobium]RUX22967.1 HNH endonuclease [Mesorhizobium sp. M2A.F.Ca.ET.037.01.1.1]RUY11811.1 HNH endonuclease [Mesorhizobium sp. M2A.F.Ca.ET.040.01.1.1]RWA83581.1 MAG: HNH endonuclease [Mesorhizobium sp.]TIV18170.1 MAG: HNH endonuclease [Mesorhizobium sp.]